MQTEPTQQELATKNYALNFKSYRSLDNKVDKNEEQFSIERLTLRSESNRSLSPKRQEIAKQQMEQLIGEPVIQCENIFKTYKLQKEGISALKDISLSPNCEFLPIRRGEFVIIRGPSGGGKTTLLNMFGMIDKPSSEIDENASDNHLSQLRMLHVGFVFQSFNLLATMTALENVELPMTLANQMSEKKIKERAKELLTKVNLKDRMNHLPSELSGGEKQRTAIARALSNCPQILLLDEPTGDLDTANSIEIMDLLLEINKTTTIVMVTHNPDLECYANRILYVEDGQITCQAINTTQSRLNLEKYLRYLSKKFNSQLHQFIQHKPITKLSYFQIPSLICFPIKQHLLFYFCCFILDITQLINVYLILEQAAKQQVKLSKETKS